MNRAIEAKNKEIQNDTQREKIRAYKSREKSPKK